MKTKLTVRRCKYCNERFQQTQPLQYLCMPPKECAWKYQKLLKDKVRAKLEKEEMKVLKDGLLTHKDWLSMLQVKINAIARGIDTNFPCISSNRTTGQMHGGHFFTTQAHPNLRFNLLNIFKQSSQDNNFKSGNITEYLFNLYQKFGSHFVNETLLKLDEKYPVLKLSVPEIKTAIEKCNSILKCQKKGFDIATTNEERISLRILINEIIGIYGKVND